KKRLHTPSVLLSDARVGTVSHWKQQLLGSTLPSMVLPPQLQEQKHDLMTHTKQVQRNVGAGAEDGYRHVLVSGDQGTGKQLFIKVFAAQAGMDYAPVAVSELVNSDEGIGLLKEVIEMTDRSSGRGTVVHLQGIQIL